MPDFDIQAARQAGYSDAEIVQYMADNKVGPMDVGGAIKAGYTPDEIMSHITGSKPAGEKPNTSIISAIPAGMGAVVSGAGKTLKHYTPLTGVGESLEAAGQKITPENYQNARVVDETGVHLGELPRAVAESAPGVGLTVAAGRAAPGLWKLPAMALAGLVMGSGQLAEDRAKANNRADPTTTDKAIGLGTGAASGAINALGAGGLVGVGREAVKSVGTAGVTQAAKNFGKDVLTNAGAGAAGNVVEQVGTTAGTEKGLDVDPRRAIESGLVGGATGGLYGLKPAAREATSSIKLRRFSDNAPDDVARVANEVQANLRDKGDGKDFFQAVERTAADAKGELGAIRAEARKSGVLNEDAENVIRAAIAGRKLSQSDRQVVREATAGFGDADRVNSLVEKLDILGKLKGSGDFDTTRKTFAGGMANKMEKSVYALSNPLGVGANTAARVLTGTSGALTLGAYSPHTLAALMGAYGLARGADSLLGTRNPGQAFVDRFANSQVEARPPSAPPPDPPPPPPNQSDGPWGPRPAQTVPSIPLAAPPEPWLKGFNQDLAEAVRATNKDAKQQERDRNSRTIAEAMPLIAALAKTGKLKADTPPSSEDTLKNAIEQTKELVKGIYWRDKVVSDSNAKWEAEQVAKSSPFVEQAGAGSIVTNPKIGAAMSKIVSGAKALKTLNSDPEAEAAAKAEERAARDEARAEERASKERARAEAKSARDAERAAKEQARIIAAAEKAKAKLNGTPKDTPKEAPKEAPKDGPKVTEPTPYMLPAAAEGPLRGLPQSGSLDVPLTEAAETITAFKSRGGQIRVGEDYHRQGTEYQLGVKHRVAETLGTLIPDHAETLRRVVGAINTRDTGRQRRDELAKAFPEQADGIKEALSDDVLSVMFPTKKKTKGTDEKTPSGKKADEVVKAAKALKKVKEKPNAPKEEAPKTLERISFSSAGATRKNKSDGVTENYAVLRERVRKAYQEIAGGFGKRVLLKDLREKLPDVPRETLDETMKRMELEDPGATLMPLDNRVDITDADRSAALHIGREPRHLLWLSNPTSKAVTTPKDDGLDIPDFLRRDVKVTFK